MTETFETFRPLLFSIAYRMVGSAMDAEDIVQEVYMKYQATPRENIRSLKNFLATIATRLSLNHLNSAKIQREQYPGPWFPEPIITHIDESSSLTPETRLAKQETISMAFLVLLESLTPVERAVFLLREVFDYEYAEIASIVDKSEATCRQIFSRAKKHIAENRPRFDLQPESHRALVQHFITAITEGDMGGIMTQLSDDVTLYTDAGGNVRGAATRPVHGKEHTALFIVGSLRFLPSDFSFDVQMINGQPGVIVRAGDGTALGVLSFDFANGAVQTVRYLGNPEKLHHL